MALAKLKDKGQITLPAEIRRALDASIGDLFEVSLQDGQVVLTPQKLEPNLSQDSSDLSQFIGSLKGTFGTQSEIDQRLREERNSWDD